MRRPLTALLLLALAPCLMAVKAAPKSMGDVTKPRLGDACSARRMIVYKHPQKGLNPPVQKMRLAIIDACVRCNYKQLEKLGLPGRKHFDFTFGKEKSPAKFWVQQEAGGHRTLAKMVATLHLPFKHDGHVYVWPSAYGNDPQDKDWAALHELYGDHDITLFQNYGGFNGMRLAIADDGDWLYAIEGD